ncbi:MAG: hypothetical protein U0270_33455 [Labilithrix sp.]
MTSNAKRDWVGKLFVATAVIAGTAGLGCLARPVSKGAPTTKVNFTSTVSQQAVDKVDLLFAIDNSQSMGDKQDILKDAVPDLIQGLLKPACVDRETRAKTGKVADPNGDKDNNYGCDATSEPEFKPVTDMHIGIVSSSLGNFGGNVCEAKNARTNDNALLVNFLDPAKLDRDTTNAPDGYLAWFPSNKENEDEKRHPKPAAPIKVDDDGNGNGLTPSFIKLVGGVGQDGCGLEAQLESVYRFLIQPDPWDVVKTDAFQQAEFGEGINVDVLKQRADFLRPDSLVAIIMLTDEDDSSSDPLSVGGFGYAFMNKDFPGSKVRRGTTAQGTTAPRGTSVCATDPGSEDCTSCGFAQNCDANTDSCQKIKQDENCTTSGDPQAKGVGYDGFYAATEDDLNVRFHRMKERFGVDPQYPLKRYIAGFTQLRVPDREGEHTITQSASGQRQISNYIGSAKCTNPLFAAQLPREQGDELCNLPRSTRSPDLIFFAVVGGVPNQLLHFNPDGDEKAAEDNRITADDWVKILGKDSEHFDYTGIDPHMIQSVKPREELVKTGGDPDLPRGQNGDDKVHGREWNTKKKDLQYACTFDLPPGKERQCAGNSDSCDCSDDPSQAGKAAGNPPLCATDGSATQIKAKAYPTIREFQVVHALGDQGIISSLCPIQLTDKDKPTYGYRPAVATIIERLKNALTTQCLPQKLRSDEEEASGTPLPVPCLVLAQLSPDSDKKCEDIPGLTRPEKAVLDIFLQQQKAESGNVGDGGLDLSKLEVCVVPQKTVAKGVSCAADADIEWCYVSNDTVNKKTPAGRCPQALLFSSGSSALAGARFSLQCIQQFSEGQAAKDTNGGGSSSSSGSQSQ